MKGATPSGPRAFVSISANGEHGGLAGDRQPREAGHDEPRHARRKVLRADPDRDREQRRRP